MVCEIDESERCGCVGGCAECTDEACTGCTGPGGEDEFTCACSARVEECSAAADESSTSAADIDGSVTIGFVPTYLGTGTREGTTAAISPAAFALAITIARSWEWEWEWDGYGSVTASLVVDWGKCYP